MLKQFQRVRSTTYGPGTVIDNAGRVRYDAHPDSFNPYQETESTVSIIGICPEAIEPGTVIVWAERTIRVEDTSIQGSTVLVWAEGTDVAYRIPRYKTTVSVFRLP